MGRVQEIELRDVWGFSPGLSPSVLVRRCPDEDLPTNHGEDVRSNTWNDDVGLLHKTRQPNPSPNAAISGGLSGGQPAAALPIGRPVTGYSYRNKSGPSTAPSKCCVNRNRSFPRGGYQLTFAPGTTRWKLPGDQPLARQCRRSFRNHRLARSRSHLRTFRRETSRRCIPGEFRSCHFWEIPHYSFNFATSWVYSRGRGAQETSLLWRPLDVVRGKDWLPPSTVTSTESIPLLSILL
jgi:hypothetical protein